MPLDNLSTRERTNRPNAPTSVPMPQQIVGQSSFVSRQGAFHRIRGLAEPANLVIVVLVVVPLLLFTYRLQRNPPGFFIDESIYGFEAYTLLKTGGFTSSGEFLPRLFHNPGASLRNHGIFVYMVLPFVGLLGLNEVAVRLTTVTSSIALLLVLYALLRTQVSLWAMVLAALWWPLTAWVFLLSRYGDALIPSALASTCAMWMLVRISRAQKLNNIDVLVLGLSVVALFFMYPAGPVQALGFVMLALGILQFRRWPIREAWKPLLSVAVILLLSVDYILDGSMFFHTEEARVCILNVGCMVRSLVSHFSYGSYFADTYIPSDFHVATHSVDGTSLVPRALLVPLVAGIVVAGHRVAKRDTLPIIMFLTLLLCIIPATVLPRGFDSYRSVSVLPIIFVLIILGLDLGVTIVSRLPVGIRVVCVLLVAAGTLFLGYQEARKLFAYENHLRAAIDWQYGYSQMLDYFAKHVDEYDVFAVTDSVAYVPQLYIRFYDPEDQYSDTIRIVDFDRPTLPIIEDCPRVLYAARPWEISPKVIAVRKTILAPNGRDVLFHIGDSELGNCEQ